MVSICCRLDALGGRRGARHQVHRLGRLEVTQPITRTLAASSLCCANYGCGLDSAG